MVRAWPSSSSPARRTSRSLPARRPRDGAPRDGEDHLPRPRRPQRPDPAARGEGGRRSRRHRRRHRPPGEVAPRRAVAAGGRARAAREDPVAAARHVPRPHRRRGALPQALPRPADERGDARRLPRAQPHRRRDPPPARRGRLRRGRDAGAAAALRRRLRAPVRDALQRARRRLLPPDRDRALPEAADRRRPRARLRDRQGLPQRGRLVQAPARVHDARVVRGVRGLPRHDGADGAAASRRWRWR